MSVASVGQVNSVVGSAIRTGFRTSSPDVPIWLDFQDQLKEQCGFAPGVSNVAVLDTAGRLRCIATGPLTPDQVMQAANVIEGLRRETILGGAEFLRNDLPAPAAFQTHSWRFAARPAVLVRFQVVR